MTRQLSPIRLMVATVALAALALPEAASAERVITRKGETVEGTPRFEKDLVVVVRPDGTEVRIPRAEVERIELTDQEAAPEAAPPSEEQAPAAEPPAAAPEQAPRSSGPPPWRPRTRPPPPPPPPPYYAPYTPPPPPPYYAPYTPPPPPPIYRERAYDQNGFVLALGYHRGLALGGEYQLRTAQHLGFGVGAQVGFEAAPNHDDEFDSGDEQAFATFGFTGRAYVGRMHRLALEAGFGLNAIDPDLAPDCEFGDEDCAVRNYGPELSAGYQFVSDRGFLFETLFGFGVVTNETYRDAHADLNPLFQLSFGYLFH